MKKLVQAWKYYLRWFRTFVPFLLWFASLAFTVERGNLSIKLCWWKAAEGTLSWPCLPVFLRDYWLEEKTQRPFIVIHVSLPVLLIFLPIIIFKAWTLFVGLIFRSFPCFTFTRKKITKARRQTDIRIRLVLECLRQSDLFRDRKLNIENKQLKWNMDYVSSQSVWYVVRKLLLIKRVVASIWSETVH